MPNETLKTTSASQAESAASAGSILANHLGVVQPKGFPGLPSGWQSEWETFHSADRSLQLFGAFHHRTGPRILVVSHGLGEHGGRYLHLPHYLQDAVDGVYCLDHRGHGRSEGLRGHADSFDQYCDDLILLIRRLDERAKKSYGKSEIHVLGHSMGGLIALRAHFAVSNLPVRSLSLSAPLLGIRVEIPLVKRMAAGTLSKLWGTLQLANEIDVNLISHDPEVVRAYQTDRLVHNRITPRLFTSMVSAIEATAKRDSGLAYPVQLMLPGEDKVTDSAAARKWFDALKHPDKVLRTYPEFYHESLNELGKEKAFDEVREFIRRRSSA